jgi:hypothetical protein
MTDQSGAAACCPPEAERENSSIGELRFPWRGIIETQMLTAFQRSGPEKPGRRFPYRGIHFISAEESITGKPVIWYDRTSTPIIRPGTIIAGKKRLKIYKPVLNYFLLPGPSGVPLYGIRDEL